PIIFSGARTYRTTAAFGPAAMTRSTRSGSGTSRPAESVTSAAPARLGSTERNAITVVYLTTLKPRLSLPYAGPNDTPSFDLRQPPATAQIARHARDHDDARTGRSVRPACQAPFRNRRYRVPARVDLFSHPVRRPDGEPG